MKFFNFVFRLLLLIIIFIPWKSNHIESERIGSSSCLSLLINKRWRQERKKNFLPSFRCTIIIIEFQFQFLHLFLTTLQQWRKQQTIWLKISQIEIWEKIDWNRVLDSGLKNFIGISILIKLMDSDCLCVWWSSQSIFFPFVGRSSQVVHRFGDSDHP